LILRVLLHSGDAAHFLHIVIEIRTAWIPRSALHLRSKDVHQPAAKAFPDGPSADSLASSLSIVADVLGEGILCDPCLALILRSWKDGQRELEA
jgi:hypothetical protein